MSAYACVAVNTLPQSGYTHSSFFVYMQVNKSATFTGSNYLQMTKSFDLASFTTGLSVSCWFQFNGTSSYAKVIDFGYPGFSGLALARFASTSNMALISHLPGSTAAIQVADGFPSGMSICMYGSMSECVCMFVFVCVLGFAFVT
jgi:hypothetical protein